MREAPQRLAAGAAEEERVAEVEGDVEAGVAGAAELPMRRRLLLHHRLRPLVRRALLVTRARVWLANSMRSSALKAVRPLAAAAREEPVALVEAVVAEAGSASEAPRAGIWWILASTRSR
jgi:hypothetical protein